MATLDQDELICVDLKSMTQRERGYFVSKAMETFLANRAAKEAQVYALRGRRFRHLTEMELRTQFALALDIWATSFEAKDRVAFDDLNNELTLRGLPFPFGEDITAAINKLVSNVEQLIKRSDGMTEGQQRPGDDVVAALAKARVKSIG